MPVAFLLPDNVTHSLPEEVKERFLTDAEGNVIWFTVPPLDTKKVETTTTVGHSVQYLAKRAEIEKRKEARRRQLEEEKRGEKRRAEIQLEEEKREAKKLLVKALGMMVEGVKAAGVTVTDVADVMEAPKAKAITETETQNGDEMEVDV
jgi:hypothetical protein